MTISAQLLKDIQSAEGLKLTAYKDSLGFWTIGYGHLLLPVSKDWTDYIITKEEADRFLEDDIAKAQDAALLLPEWPTLETECRQNAVVELVFNLGSKWRKFAETRLHLYRKEWKPAHDSLLDSLWAKEVGPTRSNRLANYILVGSYETTEAT